MPASRRGSRRCICRGRRGWKSVAGLATCHHEIVFRAKAQQSHPMQNVLIVIHLIIVLALVAVVLLQRSGGGGLGLGGGSSGVSGFLTRRGPANALTRATPILAAAFFLTSILLTMLQTYGRKPASILDSAPAGLATPA